ncbi:MAG: NAD(P)/FAD-dependent oxidoreductase [Salibacteraceae bacterium]
MRIAVIGGGAAGCFAAISAAHHHPDSEIVLLERSQKLLSKVKVSGGGRCNVTHACYNIKKLAGNYPRGEHFLRKGFNQFDTTDTVSWFEQNGVPLKTEHDGRMFPTTDQSQTVIDALLSAMAAAKVRVQKGAHIIKINNQDGKWLLITNSNMKIQANKVIIASGGSPKLEGLNWLVEMGEKVLSPVPSLFTFNLGQDSITQLQGVSCEKVRVRIQGSKFESMGACLITHWGFSGSAVLKLSAFAARYLAGCNYLFKVRLNWLGTMNESQVRLIFEEAIRSHGGKKMCNLNPFDIPNRLWKHLMKRAQISDEIRWKDMHLKSIQRWTEVLINDVYDVNGKTTFKEEFVTCGGIDLQGVDPNTMKSKQNEGIYFAGEVLDIDGVTGGFNFQAAWTTGWIAGKLI